MSVAPTDPDKGARLRALVETALVEYESALVHYTTGLLRGDQERARDVVQDAFLRLCRHDPAALEGRVKAWLFTVCRNRAYDLLRHDARWAMDEHGLDGLAQPAPDPAEESARADRNREVLACLARLPRSQQDVVRLRFQQGMSYKEIAEITGMSSGNVGFLLHTAMRRLRARLESRQRIEAVKGGQP